MIPTIPCDDCGANPGSRCADDCTSDESTRYDDPVAQYFTGLPVAVSVYPNGVVIFSVDLGEVEDPDAEPFSDERPDDRTLQIVATAADALDRNITALGS